MRREDKKNSEGRLPLTFRIGGICLAFLIIGYQAALFVQRAAVLKIEAHRDAPDTVYITRGENEQVKQPTPSERKQKSGSTHPESNIVTRSESAHSKRVQAVRESTRRVESFRFDPNTVSLGDLQRLGFSEKQAESIVNYREKGGKFRRKGDFAKSFVVSDSVYKRLEPYIDIPRVDINLADSAAFDALPGIGGYFARKMVEHRELLGGYSCTEQLMDIYHFDAEKYDALKDLICCSPPSEPFHLWSLPVEDLRKHPYIRSYSTARAIVLFRENNSRERWSIPALQQAGVLDSLSAARLGRCLIDSP